MLSIIFASKLYFKCKSNLPVGEIIIANITQTKGEKKPSIIFPKSSAGPP